nr:FAD-dependent monooxygenase [Amycolatopsis sp. FDAARGOS 1241]
MDVGARQGPLRRPTGFCGLIPLDEPLLYRLTLGDRAHRPANFRSPVPADEVHTAVAATYGPVTIKEISWLSRFSDAARYRTGRALLAGDAAHIHFPAGGQGLDLDVQDAMNLGWQLAAAIRGDTSVLDTYEPERHTVGAGVLENVAAQNGLISRSTSSRAVRALFTTPADLPDVSRHLSGLVCGLAVRYPGPGGAHPLTGTRLPGFPLPGGSRASTLFHSNHHVLFGTPTLTCPRPTVHSGPSRFTLPGGRRPGPPGRLVLLAHFTMTGNDSNPRSVTVCAHTGSPAAVNRGTRRASSRNTVRPSSRANGAPRQKCAPCPNDRCRARRRGRTPRGPGTPADPGWLPRSAPRSAFPPSARHRPRRCRRARCAA